MIVRIASCYFCLWFISASTLSPFHHLSSVSLRLLYFSLKHSKADEVAQYRTFYCFLRALLIIHHFWAFLALWRFLFLETFQWAWFCTTWGRLWFQYHSHDQKRHKLKKIRLNNSQSLFCSQKRENFLRALGQHTLGKISSF